MSVLIDITVHGLPAPQGSKKHVGMGRVVESSRAVAPWREAVRSTAAAAWTGKAVNGPLRLSVEFGLVRPRKHFSASGKVKPSAPLFPAVLPDLDKLLRSTMDALTMAGIWTDDSRVVTVTTSKVYSLDDRPYAHVVVWDYSYPGEDTEGQEQARRRAESMTGWAA